MENNSIKQKPANKRNSSFSLTRSLISSNQNPAKKQSTSQLSASVAQVKVVQSLGKVLNDEEQFHKTFQDGLQKTNGNQIMQLKNTSKKFCIGEKYYDFDEKEKIFYLEDAIEVDQANSTKDCNVCGEEFKNYKNLKYCSFCGKNVCKTCLLKKRLFPKNNEDQTRRGDICIVCDRKFFIKEMLKDSIREIESQDSILKEFQKQIDDKQKECNEIENQFKDEAAQSQIEADRIRENCNELKKKEEVLNSEIKEMEKERDDLHNKKVQIEEKFNEYKKCIEANQKEVESIETKLKNCKIENDDLDEQIRQIMSQINGYRRSGKQPAQFKDNQLNQSKKESGNSGGNRWSKSLFSVGGSNNRDSTHHAHGSQSVSENLSAKNMDPRGGIFSSDQTENMHHDSRNLGSEYDHINSKSDYNDFNYQTRDKYLMSMQSNMDRSSMADEQSIKKKKKDKNGKKKMRKSLQKQQEQAACCDGQEVCKACHIF